MNNKLRKICAAIMIVAMQARCMPLKWNTSKHALYSYQMKGVFNSKKHSSS